MIAFSAYAKVNLTLEVLGKRADGYHNIASVLQTIDLADTLSIEEGEDIQLICDIPDLASPDNLVVQAEMLLREITGCSKGAVIRLAKAIPIAAGLGGGSSDAAAALHGLNEFWELGLPLWRLLQLASELGSDVPFFLVGGTALAEGRGERVTRLPALPSVWIVLLKPPLNVANKTARLYAALEEADFTRGQWTQSLIALLRQGRSPDTLSLFNVFERAALAFYPQLGEYRQLFKDSGAASVHLAGAGPTLFALVGDRGQGEELCQCLWDRGLEAYLVRTVDVANSSHSGRK